MIRQNIFANMIGRVWGIVSVYIFIPLYLKFLGIEAYGMVGFYSTLLGVLAFADIGLTATLNREMARLSVQKDSTGEMGDLLRTYESIYLYISLILASILWFSAPFIAEHWLRANTLSTDEIASAIRLMGIAIALQLPANLYSGGLLGLQKQVLSNFLQIAWGLLRGVGAVLVLWLVSPTIFAFASWQLFSNAVYCFAVRLSLWHTLPSQISKPRFNRLVLRHTWRYAAGMAGLTFLSVILKQTDKLVVSKMLPLEIFGYYTLAASLAMAPQILANPIGIAVFPQITGLLARGERDSLKRVYHRACGLVSVVVLPAALTLALYAGRFIFAWTGSNEAASKGGLAASLLLCGSIVQAILVIPCYLALAHGNVRINVIFNSIAVFTMTPILIVLINKYGVLGAGMSWLVMNVFTQLPYAYFAHRKFLPGEFKEWIFRDVGRPLLVVLPIVFCSYFLLPSVSSRLIIFAQTGVVWIVSVAASVCVMPELRMDIVNLRKIKLLQSK